MNCPTCGTAIADKALVCFRCGTPTTQAPPPAPRRPGVVLPALALVVLVAGALYLGQVQTGQIPRALSWTIAGLGLVVIVWLLVARGRRRR